MRRLDIVAWPNGAGKSMFARLTLVPALPTGTPFVNADEIARRRWPDDAEAHAYDAAKLAAATRAALLADGRSFVAETVFSHPSKLELVDAAHAAGYPVHLHVLLVPEELGVARVAQRVASGGHAVPEIKIRERYRRLWPLLAEAAGRVDTTTGHDNSSASGPRIVARLTAAIPVGATAWPPWAPADLTAAWPAPGTA